MQIIDQKKFAVIVLNPGKKAFIIYIAYLKTEMLIYLVREAQIVLLLIEKVTVLAKYLNYANVFLKKLATYLNKLTLTNMLST